MSGRLAVAVLAIFLVVGIVVFVWPMTQESGLSASMSTTWTGEDGKPIAFINPGGSVVTGVTIHVRATITSASGAAVESPAIKGTLAAKCFVNSPTAGVVYSGDIPISESGDYALNFDLDHLYAMSTLIPSATDADKTYGWIVQFTATLTATGTVNGDPLTSAPWTQTISYRITWSTAGLQLTGQVYI